MQQHRESQLSGALRYLVFLVSAHDAVLLARIGAVTCVLPISSVVEIMRPLPIETLGDAPPHIRGIAIVRGAPTIVVDTGRLLGHARTAAPNRFVLARAGARKLALTFDVVFGVQSLSRAELAALPPLLQHATTDAVAQIGVHDREILVLLETARVVPTELFDRVEAER